MYCSTWQDFDSQPPRSLLVAKPSSYLFVWKLLSFLWYFCSRYTYKVGKWSTCDALCGVGTRNRSVKCRMEGGNIEAPSWRCSHLNKPASKMNCNAEPCGNPGNYIWCECMLLKQHSAEWRSLLFQSIDDVRLVPKLLLQEKMDSL